MTTTKTKTTPASKAPPAPTGPLMPAQAAADVEAAEAGLAAVHARITAGDPVDHTDLADAEARLNLANHRVAVAAGNAAAKTEQARLNRLVELANDLTGEGHRRRLHHLLGTVTAAEQAMAAVWAEANARQDALRVGLSEANRLARRGPLPPGVEVDFDDRGCNTVTLNGRTSPRLAPYLDEPAYLVADIAASALQPAGGRSSVANDVMAAVGYMPGHLINALKATLADLDDTDTDDTDDEAPGE